VLAIAPAATSLYVAGDFTRFGLKTRKFFSELNIATGTPTPWNPSPNQVAGGTAVLVSNSNVFVGGGFTTIGGQPRAQLAAFDRATGVLSAWNPGLESYFHPTVNAFALDGDALYIAGNFFTVAGERRISLAAVSETSGLLLPWNPDPGRNSEATVPSVLSMLKVGGRMLVGGGFVKVGYEPQANLASLSTLAALAVAAPGHTGGLSFSTAPNPARTSTAIDFTLPTSGRVSLGVFDPAGRRVAEVIAPMLQAAGPRRVRVDTSGWRPGIYFARLSFDRESSVRKLVVLP
jgi:hypothetical protein